MLSVAKMGYRVDRTDHPGAPAATKQDNLIGKVLQDRKSMPVLSARIGWRDPLIPIGPQPSQTRTSNPAVSYMSFSATPAR